jgi:hypothetical protein
MGRETKARRIALGLQKGATLRCPTLLLLLSHSRSFRLKNMTTYEKIGAGVYKSKLVYGTTVETRHAYNQDETRLHLQFKDDLFEEFGVTLNPKAGAAYNIAWEYGHAYGLHSVYDHFSDVVELIK